MRKYLHPTLYRLGKDRYAACYAGCRGYGTTPLAAAEACLRRIVPNGADARLQQLASDLARNLVPFRTTQESNP